MNSSLELSEVSPEINWKRGIFLGLGLLLFVLLYLAPPMPDALDPAGTRFPLSHEGKAALAIFLLGGVALYVGFETAIDSATGMETGGLGALAAAAGTLVAGWFLFRVVALFVLQFHADEVVRAVEARHYPQSANAARQLGFGEEMGHALRSLGRTLLANVLALPVAGLLLATGLGAAAVFVAVNALLVGRELQDAVWLRYRDQAGERAPLGAGTRFLLGLVVVGVLAIPFLNLLAPILVNNVLR